MLRFLRTKATGFFVKAIFGMIIVVFIFWGIGTFREPERKVAEIGRYKIRETEYYEEYKRLLDSYKALLKERLDEETLKGLNLKEKAIQSLIERYLILTLSERLGIEVSDAEYAEYLESIDAFKKDGKFDKKKFVEVLKKNNIDAKEFEIRQRMSMKVAKTSEILKDLMVVIDEKEIWEEYKRQNGMVRLKYAVFSPSDFEDKIEISEKELEELYEKEKNLHFSEPRYKLRYIVIDQESTLRDDKAYMELIETKDLESFAKRHNLNLNLVEYASESELKRLITDINDFSWLKDLRKDDFSLPIRAKEKSYIFQLIGLKKGEPLEKSLVLKRIKERVTSDKAKEIAKRKAEEALSSGRIRFENLTPFLKRNSSEIPKIGVIPEEHRSLFLLDSKNPIYKTPLEISGKIYVFAFDSERLPDPKMWEKEKKEFRVLVLLKKREEVLSEFLDSMKKKEKIKIYTSEL
ncbi:MAG: SurA N-terminal domain-containing protein [Deltaproteobacteria bacterium]|nr:SurA N-terminal domain-containing protein [Deltaproteobacteria bacterium]